MKIIGVTGGVGAGKSRILAHLQEQYKAFVIQADQVGHLVMEPGTEAYKKILEAFDSEVSGGIVKADGTIDRGALGAIVFADKEKLARLSGIIHPAVKDWIRREIEVQSRKGCELFIIEAALLIEDHYEEICQELWYIHTDTGARRERLKASRGYSDEKIDSIFRSQLSEEAFRQACQAVLDNSGAFEETCSQIRELFVQRGWIKTEIQEENI